MKTPTKTKAKRKAPVKSKAKVAPKARAKKAPSRAKSNQSVGRTVAIVGGGISGLAAAVKLQKAGFDVTVFEAKERLGGNLSSTNIRGIEHDVYPHMFPSWYVNFWDLYENELGFSRSGNFDPRPGVKMLARGASDYIDLLNPTSLDAIVANLKSGLLSPAEMLLTGYTSLDIASAPMGRTGAGQLDKLDVNGFLHSGGYATEDVAEMVNYMLQVIWSIQSERTAAVTYQDFVRHTLTFPDNAPFAHMLKGSLNDKIIAPIEELLVKGGATIHRETPVSSVRMVDGKPALRWSKAGAKGAAKSGQFDSVILAAPGKVLNDLVSSEARNLPGQRLLDREPSLAQLRRLKAIAIPVIDLYLKIDLPEFPPQNIGLAGAQYGLSVLDISKLWPAEQFDGKAALVLAASDGEALPGTETPEWGWAMLQELSKYYPDIDIGTKWGDPNCDVDWANTYARSNEDYTLFLNDVGSWGWRPQTAYPETLPGIFFAGDLCRSNVDMATIEGAVESGVLAAKAVQDFAAKRTGRAPGMPIDLVKHTTYGDPALRAAKQALMPFAYAAKFWVVAKQAKERGFKNIDDFMRTEEIALLPMVYVVDWWTSAYWFWRAVLDPNDDGNSTAASNHDDDNFIGLGAAVLMVLGEFASYATEKCSDGSLRRRNSADATDHSPIGSKRRWHPKR
ncbi:FAD-dependent oxidoreductase [Pontixanthobacter aestiaquae]|uniref:FAD-dependent oxidoreductase n=1 Tax=Pontixanthobacter aestiaquae TaxID=1509367 RepID=A0A844Z8T6_9SPHN|nr:FAD-dependent oxidoreductase [Pontixanthobacter aestiaquae]MDN3644656.1 FAD-dependent oxidoreductase [Pontixanthobacter aestiaquae]MXO84335.1 FAD-dependent oxidoreductase [Pontixanthobacter aestiaquae]